MIKGHPIWSGGGRISNLVGGDLTVSCGGQTLNESVGRWLVVAVREWGTVMVRIHIVWRPRWWGLWLKRGLVLGLRF